ncbi:MAG: hypothetical protein M9932_04160 [Xanthobacteraceae bacterium]|nr:hypothetical protein [Xanthobacteraceae bacterium]
MKELWSDDAWRTNELRSRALRGISPQQKEKISASLRETLCSPDKRERMSESMAAVWHSSADYRAKQSRSKRDLWLNDQYREGLLVKRKELGKRRRMLTGKWRSLLNEIVGPIPSGNSSLTVLAEFVDRLETIAALVREQQK